MTPRGAADKVLSREELVGRFGPGRKGHVVFTNGCFDLLHLGHATYLERARALGDALVVGVNTDASARRLSKGPGHPFVSEADRAGLVASLESVDAVCLFGEDTPLELIRDLVPDVLVKGADYGLDEVVGREVVEAAGGRVELIPLVEGRSTSTLVTTIRQEGRDG
jgi:D-beta-D-heptose 7-phosphate kinase/D-beta-D-heptose 1-phosphate adenosyltransferase